MVYTTRTFSTSPVALFPAAEPFKPRSFTDEALALTYAERVSQLGASVQVLASSPLRQTVVAYFPAS